MRIHWFSVDERPVREKKNIQFKKYQDSPFGRDNFSLCTDPPHPSGKIDCSRAGGGGEGGLYIGKIICECSIKASTRVSQEVDR